ncbi:hypothetical protein ACC668_33135 [Rhizobium ruizarguesonis]
MPKDFKKKSKSGAGSVITVVLTNEQKETILNELGLCWDVVTIDAEIGDAITAEMRADNANLLLAAAIKKT